MPRGISEKCWQRRRAIAESVEELGSRVAAQREWNCSPAMVDKCCREFDIQPVHIPNDRQVIEILWELVNTDNTCQVIGEGLGFNYHTASRINRIAVAAGFDTRRPVGRPRKDKDNGEQDE